MAISKSFAINATDNTSGTVLTSGSFDSSGKTHIVIFFKSEGGNIAITPSDNKSSSGWSSLTKEVHTNGELQGQLFWAAIGSPGTGHTATATLASAGTFRGMVVWLITAGTTVELDAQTNAEGSSNAPDAGSLGTSGASVVSFFGMGLFNTGATAATGWTEDYDGSIDAATYSGYSRGAETTTPIDPAGTWATSDDWVAVAGAFREASGGGAYNAVPVLEYYQTLKRGGIFH